MVRERFLLTGYIEEAMAKAEYDKLEDGTFAGRIPACKGVVAFGSSLSACENELRSTLEDWIWVGLKLGQPLPRFKGFDLNRKPAYEPMDTM
jgi:predicted RNase H-like HicB family nuclease